MHDVAATLAIDASVNLRDVDIHALQTQLVKKGSVVDRPSQHSQAGQLDGSGVEDSIHWQAVDERRAFG